MAESNATQVILTDDGIKIINAKNTADNAASLASKADSAALIAQSKANAAKSAADSSYKYANSEIAVQSTATAKAQETADDAFSKAQAVGSQASKEIAVQSTATAKAQSKADDAFSKATAVDNKTSKEILVQSTATAKAQETADNAFSKATAVGSQASAEILVQSTATAKAQSKADDAFSKATTAIDNGKVTSQVVTALKDGSKLTIAELENGLATKVANSDYASYKEQTASQIGQLVTNGAFSAYQQTTADLISSKVATKDFSAYQDTTAKAIESKVESNDFNTYKSQTADTIAEKVANKDFSTYKTQTAGLIESKVDNGIFSSYKTETSDLIASKVATKDFSTYQKQTADLISQKVATKDFSAYQATTAKAIESKVESKDFNTYKSQTADSISSKVSSIDFNNLGGGRNYLLNSKLITITPTGQANYDYRIYLSDDFWKNPDRLIANNIKVSFTMRVKNALSKEFNSWVYFGASPWYNGPISYPAGTTKLQKYKLTYSITDSTYTANNLFIRFQDTNTADNPFIIENVTLSIGSNFVDWSPAPEDQATQSQITQLSGEIEQKVNSGDFSTYKSQTADLIAEKVATKDFSTYKEQTANLISEKVTNKDFTAYQATTAKSIESKVEFKDFNTYKTQTDGLISQRVTNKDFTAYQDTTAKAISSKVESKDFNTYKTQTADLIAEKVANKDFSTYKTQTADLISEKVANKDFTAYQATTAKAISSKVESRDFNTYKSQTADAISSKVATKDFSTYKSQTADAINIRVTKKDLIDQINVQAGNTLISSSGQLTLAADTIYFDTKKPVIIPNANIADTLNGKTFHGGDIISNANNTAKYYPMTITPDGAYKSTYFDSAVGLQSSVESGAISYKYRSMIGNGTYSYDNVAINGQGITLDSGTTTTKDTTFSAPETETAYISLTTEAGLYLHGSNANIDFGGHLSDDSTSVGMYMNPYGNLIAKSASHYWQISVAGTDNTGGGPVARFGIDRSNAYNIEFNRELDIGNFHINTGHTFTSADGDAIHFAKGRGGAVDIYAGDVHYTSLVKSSLLSVKRDVQKADTAYWAQLVNSIDLATYQYKTDDNTSHLRLSSIVDDVNDIKQWRLPDVFISRDEKGKLCGVDDSVLLNATLATVQEQQKEIDQLNGHNIELEARLNKLEAKLNG
ncbi:hypothetical protein N7X57_05625 [Lactiplantibacillus paraplantarum]|uniref:hypothetical protein n=1 Tax=Lactiplantibacillus paraplantarum TaxID=60520 RepID=UPI002221D0D3|nr:hypothetical protein [Lactiplantibacillus paraplantarum]MCW1909923.1 hypothetical protein [Lactiplantibacillus paraplantarum]